MGRHRESDIQSRIIKEIHQRLPHAFVFKGDTRYKQGTPDLIILNGDKWAMLEVKRDKHARVQPNQEYYIGELNKMSFATFIHPGNEEETLDALQRALEP